MKKLLRSEKGTPKGSSHPTLPCCAWQTRWPAPRRGCAMSSMQNCAGTFRKSNSLNSRRLQLANIFGRGTTAYLMWAATDCIVRDCGSKRGKSRAVEVKTTGALASGHLFAHRFEIAEPVRCDDHQNGPTLI